MRKTTLGQPNPRYPLFRSENKLLTSNLNQVCVCVQTNILNAEFKCDKIFVTKWKLYEDKKPLQGSQTQEIHYPKIKLVTRHSYSHNPMQ
jgi:hypothetical protein